MWSTLKTICLNTPILNAICLVFFNGIFVKHYIQKYMEQKKIAREDMVKILRELKTPEEDIQKYLAYL